MASAIGMLEVQGYSVALAAMDKACKAATIQIKGIDSNNPSIGDVAPIPVVIQVKFTGEVSDVEVALEAAKEEACRYIPKEDVLTHIIPAAFPGIEGLLAISKVKRRQ